MLTQSQVAQRAAARLNSDPARGFDVTYLSKIEKARLPPPSAKAVIALATVLDTDADDLLALSGKTPPVRVPPPVALWNVVLDGTKSESETLVAPTLPALLYESVYVIGCPGPAVATLRVFVRVMFRGFTTVMFVGSFAAPVDGSSERTVIGPVAVIVAWLLITRPLAAAALICTLNVTVTLPPEAERAPAWTWSGFPSMMMSVGSLEVSVPGR